MKQLIWRFIGPVMAVIAVSGAILQTGVAQAAPEAQGQAGSNVTFNFLSAQYFSFPNGALNGSAILVGQLGAGGTNLSALSGELNLPFPNRDRSIRVTPKTAVLATTSNFLGSWGEVICDQFGCRFINHTYTQTTYNSTVPVEVRTGSLHGTGRLSWSSTACTAGACPPWFVPSSSANLFANMVSAQESGTLSMSGPGPIIQ